ncbi:MAG: hypothetical protein D6782_04595, partial [Alphaproteobacteria bacterium]
AAIAERRFAEAMSSGYGALDSGDFEAAARAFAQARALKPQSDAPVQAMQRLARARDQAALADLRVQAQRQVDREAWAEAVNTYRKALAIDPNVTFAVQGLPQAQTRARMDAAITRYLADPTRLYSREPLANAIALMDSIARIDNPGPKLAAQSKALARLIEAARTPVGVAFASDGLTEVSIFTIGPLGRFTEKSLDLTPGDYIAVGTRKGYRDVRVEFSVRPNRPPDTIVVICRETV